MCQTDSGLGEIGGSIAYRVMAAPVRTSNRASNCFGLASVLTIVKEHICDPSGRNQSHVGRVRFPLRAEMHGRAHITDSCFIAFITSKIS